MPETGAVLAGRYELSTLLGKGGMGYVYAARDRKLMRDVAVKLLGSATLERDALRRFGREALAAGALQHPNVVAVYDFGDEGGRPFLVTELLRGSTLRALLDAGRLPLHEVRSIARQVASGLAAAHEKGFIHRDLKPENIFVSGEGWVKILDFGLVKLAESLHVVNPADASATGVDRTLGTIGYMAPEQVRGQPLDQRADLFNFGLVLYEMLSGKRAFTGESHTETSYAIISRRPAPLPLSAPRNLRRLVQRCLEKDREKRPASAREVLQMLQRRGAPLRLDRRWAAVALAIAAAAGVALIVQRAPRLFRPSPPPAPVTRPAGSVAILPFDASEAPDFAALAEGVSDLLNRDFQGGALRAVDTASVLRVIGRAGTADVDRARVAASQLGARYFVLGRIEEKQGRLQIEAVLHDVQSGNPVTQGVAQGDRAEVLKSIRSLSDELQGLRRTREDSDARLASLAFRTSSSPEALQAWLLGERLMRESRYEDAIEAFRRAVIADPEFALAHSKLGVVATYARPVYAEQELESALRYRDRLSRLEQMMVQGRLEMVRGALAEAEHTFVEATRSFPDEPSAWIELGDFQFHDGPVLGRSIQDALPALQRAVVFDPTNTEVMDHLGDLALLRGERQAVAMFADRLTALTDDPATVVAHRLAHAWANNDRAEYDQLLAGVPRLGSPRAILTKAVIASEWTPDAFGDGMNLANALAKRDGFIPTAAIDLLHGRADSARARFNRASQEGPGGDSPYYSVWLDSLPEFEIAPAELEAARAKTARLIAEQPPDSEKTAGLLHIGGTLALRARDFAAAERSAAALAALPALGASSITQDLARSIRARILFARGNPSGALALLDHEALKIPVRYMRLYGFRASESFFRASVLEALGRREEALPLYEAMSFYSYSEPIFGPIAHLRKARIYEALGDLRRAADHYQAFADLWNNCDAVERPVLDGAKRALAAVRQKESK
jgi:tetratricopeptide (TPR) repeat protein